MKRILILSGLLLLMGASLFGQSIRVMGTVTSQQDGTTIPGVSVMVRGTTMGTVTDINGRYELQVAPTGSLIFSFIGYTTREVRVDGREVINVALAEEVFEIEGVVVTALGISRERRALSYSVQGVSGDDISEVKDANLVNSLSGKIAGIQVTNSTGGVGSSSRITIRGNSSFGNNQPLFVVDGTPVSNFASGVSQWGGADYGNAIMDIDPANIASISVLKGGMAAALYGQNASNGVILITTKDGGGRAGSFGVNISSSVTFENPYIFPEYQNLYGQGYNGEEFLYRRYLTNQNLTEAQYSYQQYSIERSFRYVDGNYGGMNDGQDESWGPRLDIGLNLPQFNSPFTLDANGLPVFQSTPWISHPNNARDFFETGLTLDNSFEVFGSGEKTSARLGVSSMNISGTIPNTDLTRYSVAFSGDMEVSRRFTAKATVNYVRNTSGNLPSGGYDGTNIMQSIGGWFGRQVDMQALKDNWQTKDVYGRNYNWNHSYHNNPYFTVHNLLNARDRDRFFGNLMLNYKLTDWMSLTGRIGSDYFGENRKETQADGAIGVNVTQGGWFTMNDRTNNEFNADLFLNFDRTIGSDFRIDGLLGANYYNRTYRFQSLTANELTVPDLFTIGNVSGSPQAAMYEAQAVSNSVFGSVNISFRNFLFLNATGRNDWSSTLPSDAWSYFYPSVGLGLIFTDAFGIESNILSYGKIRGSLAKIGKATEPYNTIGTYASAPATFKGVTQFFINRTLPPIGLKNEETTSYEFGLEMAFLMNRVNFDFTYFNNLSRNQILNVNISNASGYGAMLINAGEIQNKGVELLVNGGILRNRDGLNWDVTLNWSKIDNMVNELYGDLEAYQISSSWGGLTIEARPGKPFGTIMGPGFARDEQGRVIVSPTTGRVIKTPVPIEIGNIMPDWLGGLRNSFSYKGINLSLLVDMRMGGDLFSVTHWFGGYAGIAGFTAADGLRETGVIVGGNVLQQWGAVTAATVNGVIQRDENGFPIGSGETNTRAIPAQQYFGDFWGNPEASIIDGSYIKLREISIGYDLPRSIVNQLGFVKRAQISLVGRNLALLYTHESNTINIDPETAFGVGNAGMGLEQFQLPSSRSIGFKINLSF
jgi:TonB-linked SusC/RagA family outer membrane protein